MNARFAGGRRLKSSRNNNKRNYTKIDLESVIKKHNSGEAKNRLEKIQIKTSESEITISSINRVVCFENTHCILVFFDDKKITSLKSDDIVGQTYENRTENMIISSLKSRKLFKTPVIAHIDIYAYKSGFNMGMRPGSFCEIMKNVYFIMGKMEPIKDDDGVPDPIDEEIPELISDEIPELV